MVAVRIVQRPPSPALAPFVRCLWIIEGAGEPGPDERVVPDGCVELLVHWGEPMRRLQEDGRWGGPQHACLVGQIRSALLLRAAGPVGMISARLHPWAVGALLGDEATQVTDDSVDLDALWGRDAQLLVERLAEARGDDERFDLLEAALARRLARPRHPPEVEAAARLLGRRAGALTMDVLAREVGWGRRRLERHFAREVGVSPKTLARIERVQDVVQRLEQATAPAAAAAGAGAGAPDRGAAVGGAAVGRVAAPGGLAGLALDAGFADQAHLSRDFRSLVGLPVTGWLREQHALSDCLTSGDAATPDIPGPPRAP